MPEKKFDRSEYNHLDSIEPDVWARILTAMHASADSTEVDRLPGVYLGDSASIDAFARLRVSDPVTVFDSQSQYDGGRVHWEESVTDTSGNAAATHDSDQAEVQLYVEAEDIIIRQTRQYFRYQPGKSHMVFVTFAMDSPATGLTQRVGYFDGENGVFFECEDGAYSVAVRSSTSGSPVDTAIAQASWNLDPLDGTGPSGITADFTKAQILLVDMEWLGVGRVRVGFVIDGVPVYVHQFLHANIVSGVYMTTANLPVRYEIRGSASLSGGATLQSICSSVISEGGQQFVNGLQFSASNESTLRTVTDASEVPLVAIRPKALYNGITNRGRITLETFAIYSAAVPVHYRLVFGATLTGGSWASVNDDSIVEYNVGGTSYSGGIHVDSGYVPATVQNRGVQEQGNSANYPAFLDISGSHPTSPYTDVWLIAAISLGNNTDCGASLDVREIR